MIPHLPGDVPNPVVGVNQQQQQPAGGGNLLFEAFFPQVRGAFEGGAFFANLRPQRRAELQQELLIWDFFWRIANRAINRKPPTAEGGYSLAGADIACDMLYMVAGVPLNDDDAYCGSIYLSTFRSYSLSRLLSGLRGRVNGRLFCPFSRANNLADNQAFRVAIDFLTTHYGEKSDEVTHNPPLYPVDEDRDHLVRVLTRLMCSLGCRFEALRRLRRRDITIRQVHLVPPAEDSVAGSSHWNGLPLDNLAGEGYNRIPAGIQVPVYQVVLPNVKTMQDEDVKALIKGLPAYALSRWLALLDNTGYGRGSELAFPDFRGYSLSEKWVTAKIAYAAQKAGYGHSGFSVASCRQGLVARRAVECIERGEGLDAVKRACFDSSLWREGSKATKSYIDMNWRSESVRFRGIGRNAFNHFPPADLHELHFIIPATHYQQRPPTKNILRISDFQILSIPTAGATTAARLRSLRTFLDNHVPFRIWLAQHFVFPNRKALLNGINEAAKWLLVLNIQEPQPFNLMHLNNHRVVSVKFKVRLTFRYERCVNR